MVKSCLSGPAISPVAVVEANLDRKSGVERISEDDAGQERVASCGATGSLVGQAEVQRGVPLYVEFVQLCTVGVLVVRALW